MTNTTTLTAYASAFLASMSLFGLVDAVHMQDDGATTTVSQAFLLPVLGIAAATFLAVTLMALSRGHLRRPHRWNDERTERRVLEFGLAVSCYFGLLALLGYLLALLSPGWMAGTAPAMARNWAWFLAIPCLLLGGLARRNKPAWLGAGAVFATLALFMG